jgi:hypothetical protein
VIFDALFNSKSVDAMVVCLLAYPPTRETSEAGVMKYQLLLFLFSFVPAAFFLLLALLGWNTMPLAAITGATGLVFAVGRPWGLALTTHGSDPSFLLSRVPNRRASETTSIFGTPFNLKTNGIILMT